MSDLADDMAERAIQEAMARGEFDNLPGSGRPLNLSGDTDTWLDALIEREQLDRIVFAPTVLGLRREAQHFPHSLVQHDDAETVRRILTDYNHRVKLDRLRPALDLPIPVIAPLVDVDEMVTQWAALRAAGAPNTDARGSGRRKQQKPAAAREPKPARRRWWRIRRRAD